MPSAPLSCQVSIGGLPLWKACRPLLPIVFGAHPPSCHPTSIVAVDNETTALADASSSSDYSWHNISFPTTALAVLLEHDGLGLGESYPVSWLYEGMHLDLIPDISVVGRGYYTLLYEIEIGPKLLLETDNCFLLWRNGTDGEPSLSLELEGIHYRATAWWNRKRILVNDYPPGMFARHTYPIIGAGTFQLLIAPPDHPGFPDPTTQGGRDHGLARDGAVPQYMAGWDWVAPVPDRATGVAGSVVLRIPQHQNPSRQRLADCAVQTMELVNPASYCDAAMAHCSHIRLRILATVTGGEDDTTMQLLLRVQNRDSVWDLEVSNMAEEVQQEVLSNESLCLWWPHHVGPGSSTACLETFTFSLYRKNGTTLELIDQQQVQVGIRTIETFLDEQLQGQRFRINGHDIYLVGGNWIGTDLTWQYSDSRDRYCDELRLHQQAGLNLLRVWGGGTAERSLFYQCADELGLLVLQEFWMTGDQNGRWAGSYDWPLDHDAYLYNVRDTVLRLRSHASLLLYVGCNECLAPIGQFNPPLDIDTETRRLVEMLDPGRFYISSSMGGPNRADRFEVPSSLAMNRTYSLAYTDGPYGLLHPEEFFERNPGLVLQNASVPIAFQPEIGSVGCPRYSGLLKFMDELEIDEGIPPRNGMSNSTIWNYHKFEGWTTTDSKSSAKYDHVYSFFSASEDVSANDWVAAAQLAIHKQYQSLFDGFISHMFEYTTAVIFWKTQSPWPSFRGFLYDWYLETTGALRGVRASLANPVSIVFDQKLHRLRFVNRNTIPLHGSSKAPVAAGYEWIRMDGQIAEQNVVTLPDGLRKANFLLPSMSTVLLGDSNFPWPGNCTSVCFLHVWPLMDPGWTSWYWLTDWTIMEGTGPSAFSALGELRRQQSADPRLKVYSCEQESSTFLRIDLGIAVPRTSEAVLFYPTLQVWCGAQQLLPVFDEHESDIVVLPGQTKNRTLSARANGMLPCPRLHVVLASWNAASRLQFCNHAPTNTGTEQE